MEYTIPNHLGNSFCLTKSKKDKAEFNKNVKFSKNLSKEEISISRSELVRIIGKPKFYK